VLCCDDETLQLPTTERDSEPASFYKKKYNTTISSSIIFNKVVHITFMWQQLEKQQFIFKNSNLD